MEQIDLSETSVDIIQTPRNYPEESIQLCFFFTRVCDLGVCGSGNTSPLLLLT